ncbi:MAG: hypothetical protein FH756_06055 [Firmicutes bacterium]|nr:hypothetical protein [Bacillota bacterium]
MAASGQARRGGREVSAVNESEVVTVPLQIKGRLKRTRRKCPGCGGRSIQEIKTKRVTYGLCQYPNCHHKWVIKYAGTTNK